MERPLQERVWVVCKADMARIFEFVLHLVRCDTVTVCNTIKRASRGRKQVVRNLKFV